LNFNYFGVNSKFFDSFLGSLRKLIALRSTHSENLNLSHVFASFTIIF
jgi:hypothetical protein